MHPIPSKRLRATLSALLLPLALPLTLAACSSAPNTHAHTALQDVTLVFAAHNGAAAVRCDQPLTGLGLGATTAELRDLRFYVSELALMRADGAVVPVQLAPREGGPSPWQDNTLALIDLADGSGSCNPGSVATNAQVHGRVPPGRYTGLRFTVGVPHAQNHGNVATAAAPLDVQAMAWAWQAGRKFLQVEINPAGGVQRPSGAAGRSFLLHLGAASCTGNPVSGETVHCARPNRMQVMLTTFDSSRHQVVLDLAALYAGSELGRDGGGALGCMSAPSDPECAPLFQALGVDLASGLSLDAGARQTVFRAALR